MSSNPFPLDNEIEKTEGGFVVRRPEIGLKPQEELLQRSRGGARLLYVIAILSLLNSILDIVGHFSSRFVFGLEISSIMAALFLILEGPFRAVPAGFIIFFAGVFASLGIFTGKGHKWSMPVALVLYFLDMLLFMLSQQDSGLSFHVFVLILLLVFYQIQISTPSDSKNQQPVPHK